MSNLWWLNPEWKQRDCAECGVNIWKSGGDPDWGKCFECFDRDIKRRKDEEDLIK